MSVTAFDFVDGWLADRRELTAKMPATITWNHAEMRKRLLEAYVAGWNRAITEMDRLKTPGGEEG